MKDLSKPDLNLMMDLIYESLTCSSETGFLSLADKLRTLIGFTHIRSLVGDSEQYKIKKNGGIKHDHFLS
ncbi:hypothetical protein [uncultured Desulfuromusa sp.]|uniref:hypothetical protein n=1 Tax=uncultured Desulfuromusa sp. TaxID=219183 RepID=UPI002AA65FF1|nr:hypothetical protein [uncultured Desulfuromusa sp.]